jgi:hypothetical protein
MKKQTILLPIFFFISITFLSFCASIINSSTQRIFISTDSSVKKITVQKSNYIDSTSITPGAVREYDIVRNKTPLIITLRTDSIEKKIILKPINSFAYWWNIEYYGIGMLVDKNNKKRYAHHVWNYFSIKDTIQRQRFPPITKNSLTLSLAVSPANGFNVKANNTLYTSISILGAEGGLDYHYKPKQFVSLSIGSSGNEHSIVDHIGPGYIQWQRVFYMNLCNNNVIGDFSLGYGLNISRLQWGQRLNGDTLNRSELISNTAIGPSFSAQYRLGQYSHLGILYQPCLFILNNNSPWNYQHYISVRFIWELPINKAAKKFEQLSLR